MSRMGVQMALGGARGVGKIRYDAQRPSGPIGPNLRRAAGYFRPYWRSWLLILLCVAVTAGLGLIPPLMAREIIDRALPERDAGLLVMLEVGSVLAGALGRLVGVGQFSLNVRIGQGVMFDLRNALYQHLQRQSLRFFTANKTGEVMSRVNNDVAGVESVVTNTVVNVVTNVVTIVAITTVV